MKTILMTSFMIYLLKRQSARKRERGKEGKKRERERRRRERERERNGEILSCTAAFYSWP